MAIERERKFLVTAAPPGGTERVEIHQGYLAVDRAVQARVRRLRTGDGATGAGTITATLTIKAGEGATRVEVERSLTLDEFDDLWPHTLGRRLHKVRTLHPSGDVTVEVDTYLDELVGLVVAEVEFDSDAAMRAFVPPAWLGAEVTGDPAYSNAALAR